MGKIGEHFAHAVQPLKHATFHLSDVNGFIQLFFDNASTALLTINILLGDIWIVSSDVQYEQGADFYNAATSVVSSKANDVVWGRIIPGLALAMIFGNTYYGWLACRVSYDSNQEKGNTSAIPFGLNTPAAFGFIYSILLPAFLTASADCGQYLTSGNGEVYGQCVADAIETSWSTGVVSNFCSGLFIVVLGIFGKLISRVTPAGPLLSSLATVGVAFLAISQLGKSFADPISGVLPILVMLIGYLSGVNYSVLPVAFVIVTVGTALGWMNGAVNGDGVSEAAKYVKFTGVGTGIDALGDWSSLSTYLGVVIPFAIMAAANTLMNVYSATAAHDNYMPLLRRAMIADGVSCLIGGFFGCVFQTTSYIGHPAYKRAKTTMGYSFLNCIVFFLVSITGLFALINSIVPATAISPVILFVGLMISEESVRALELRQFSVFVFAIVPGICDWAITSGVNFSSLGEAYFGFVALSKSNLLFALILGCIVMYTLDRDYLPAIGWSIFGGFCAAIGLIHQSTVSVEDYNKPYGQYCLSKSTWNLAANGTCPENYVECTQTDQCGYELTSRWRFLVTYLMFAGTFAILYLLQRYTDRVDAKVIAKPHDIPFCPHCGSENGKPEDEKINRTLPDEGEGSEESAHETSNHSEQQQQQQTPPSDEKTELNVV